ncbi:MAG: translation initiation factor eIF-5A [Candidatus Parvarchaeum acidophilus ARMAN-5]|jgi:translation initiation factor 5A|uniref:Translation initiation factor 5A n=1 Tax=Candidatus Parvarchaeum acidophilus ARMAN-5 TaxID=662762 RepID=D6GVK9_PARA5|nr:MAG: translation initiation factor eIF-5A [Candidatus Parvarchaeum acidophilus ARMAN-5]
MLVSSKRLMDFKVAGINELRKGDTILVDDQFICKITDLSLSAPGKHGHAKARVEAVGILDGKKRVFVMSAEDRAKIPIIEKRVAQVISLDGNKAQLMDMESYEVFDADIPEELKDKIKDGVQVTYSDLMGQKLIKSLK